jgi:N4-gp56 family major capsid protein
MPTVTSTNLSKLIPIYYEKRMLERLVPQLFFYQFGEKKALPKREGQSVYWHRWNDVKLGRMIAESGAGAGEGISATRVSAQLLLIGHHAKVTTYIDMVSINSIVQGAIDLFADSSAKTVDFVTSRFLLWKLASVSATIQVSSAAGYIGDLWQTMSSQAKLTAIGCSTLSSAKWQAPVYCINDLTKRTYSLSAGCAGGTSGTEWTPNILRTIALKLKVKNALRFEDGYYKLIMHPDMVHQLRSSSAFIDLHKYVESGASTFEKGTLRNGTERGLEGFLEGFKIYSSTEAPMFSTSGVLGGIANGKRAQVSAFGGGRLYFNFAFGKGAYGVTDFDGGIRTFIKTPGPSSTDNPLDLYSTVGYRAIFTAKVLNPSACMWIVNGRPKTVG